jgi:formamidopyrimidine-DNA glycosylase
MPEGPTLAKQVDKILVWLNKCKTIIGINWDRKSRYATREKMKGISFVKLPLTVKNVYSHGKLLIFVVINSDGKILYMVSHLGMSGYWSGEKNKYSNLYIKFGRQVEQEQQVENVKQEHYTEIFRLYYDDMRKFGSFCIYEDLTEVLKKNGPCLMQAALHKYENKVYDNCATLKDWTKTLSKLNKKICEFMMEQKYFSGIGNYLRAEILYRCKIHPEKIELSKDEIHLLYFTCLKVMYKSYKNKLNFKCYGRTYDDLGNIVEHFKDSNKRTVHFVKAVQKIN